LRIPQFSNRRCVFWLPSSQPPICTGDQPFSLAFRPARSSRRLACLQLCLPTQRPDSHRLSDSSVGSPDKFPACAFNLLCRSTFWPIRRLASPFPPSGPPFGSTCDFRRLLFLQPAFRPASSSRSLAYRPAPLSCRSPACAFNRPSSPAFEPNLRLSSAAASFGFAFVPTLQLAPPVNLPAVLSSQLPACAVRQPSSSAFEPACDLRRLLFRAPPSCQSPACAFNRLSGPPSR